MVYLNSGTAPVTKKLVLKKRYKKKSLTPKKRKTKQNSKYFPLNTDTNM